MGSHSVDFKNKSSGLGTESWGKYSLLTGVKEERPKKERRWSENKG